MKFVRIASLLFAAVVFLAACSPAQSDAVPTLGPEMLTQASNFPEAAASAQRALAEQLGLNIQSITIVQVEPVEWPDACLGIETEGMACAQVITPGFRVILEANGQRYEFHTDSQGADVRNADPGGAPSG